MEQKWQHKPLVDACKKDKPLTFLIAMNNTLKAIASTNACDSLVNETRTTEEIIHQLIFSGIRA